MAVEYFSPGSYIIPMDTTYQNGAAIDTGMISAYGLVYALLKQGIPVKWAIKPGKTSVDDTDFIASAQDIQTSAIINSHNYSGGPFIIDFSYAALALPIIQSWQLNHSVTVHQATAAFTAPVAMTLRRAPRISIEERNARVIIKYLNSAGIPDSNGNVWTTSSPDVLDHATIANYGFLSSAADPCKRLKYDIFLSAHTNDRDWSGNNPVEVAARDALDTFLRIGGMLHATCHSIQSIENIVGPFITSTFSVANQGDTFFVEKPDFPLTQAVSTPTAPSRPGGAVNTWTATYLPSAQRLAYFRRGTLNYDFLAAGSYKGGTGAGKIVYEGGHEYTYDMKKPYTHTANTDMIFLRYLLNSVLFSVGKPRIALNASPLNIPVGFPSNVVFSLDNEGGSEATSASVTITLAPFATYNFDASIPPTSIVGQTLTWDETALSGHTGPGTILTFTASVTPPSPGFNTVASYYTYYDDNFNESYSLNYCTSIQATPGAAPFLDKTPAYQTVNPNNMITWSITLGNYGTLSLNNVVVKDTLPPEFTFVSAVPAPSSIVGNVITWNMPPIPPLNPAAYTITLTVLAPPATTRTFINQVTMTGTDTSPASYSITDTAEVSIINRPPQVTVLNPNGGEIICNGTTITWVASDPDGDPLTYKIQYSTDGGASYNTLVSGLTAMSYVWNTSGLPSSGNYLIKVIASDGELEGENTSDSTFTIDNTPPAVSWISPINNSFIKGYITLKASATDNVGVTETVFEYSNDGGINYNLIAIVTTSFDNVYAVSFDTTLLPDGPYKLKVTAFDGCSNTTAKILDIVIDNTPPVVNIVSPPDGSTVSEVVDLLISAHDNECLAKVDIYIDDVLVHTEIVGNDTDIQFIYEWDTAQFAEGAHVVKAVATDCGGLTAETSHTYIIDNLPDHYTQILIDGTLEIPVLKPDVEKIINFEVIAEIDSIKTIKTLEGTKVIISGHVTFEVTYSSTSDDQKVHFAHFTKPFLGYIIWPELPLDAELCPVIILEHKQYHLLNPRTIRKSVVLFVGIKLC
ncbi:conserved repeat domain-containing protein [Thermosyntropha lipolytica DSM 11003]|uniref:Conserved repeat domain-containing protein n=1 Tax=Thermosyntropha lipolytica DSM 11003 TaxID=1123382 RepID=A0A1M5NFS5_9FIRM|nr:Ig-like domain-containing protein [Thermosyntropha lipolytica]SHG88446.1 conserved repeat domain-containing protein [Thermosyntropha lipolytica DSM 11003]